MRLYKQWHRPMSKRFLTPYREQPRSTRNVVAYPRPAFSAKKRKNYAPTSYVENVRIQYILSQKEALLVSCRSYLEEVHALPGCRRCSCCLHIRRQENNVSCFYVILVSEYFSLDRNPKVLGNPMFGKNNTSLEFVVVVVVSYIQRIGCQPEKILYTVANPARGLLNREKNRKRKSLAAHSTPPLPPRCSFGENKRADARKRYTAMVPRHKGVHMNTP